MKVQRFAAVCGLLAAVGSWAGASADLVVFTPASGTYAWNSQAIVPAGGPLIPPNALDPMLHESGQTGAITLTSIYQTYESPLTSSTPVFLNWRSGGKVSFAGAPVASFSSLALSMGSPSSYNAPRDFSTGSPIDGSGLWLSELTVAWGNGFQAFNRTYYTWGFGGEPPQPFYVAHENPAHFYAGLRIETDEGFHYGWIEVQWNTDVPFNVRHRYDIVRWAYETEIGVAAAVPPACACDTDGSGQVDSTDFFAFLDDYFAGDIDADFNEDWTVNSTDFFGFLECYFAGCE